MKIRVIDYVASLGGGLRFAVELLRALREAHRDLDIEVVSFGAALEHYKHVLSEAGLPLAVTSVRPLRSWTTSPATRTWGIPGTGRLKRLLRYGTRPHYAVPTSALSECDAVWFPWIRRHRLPRSLPGQVLGTLHDVITLQWPGLLPKDALADERATTHCWLASTAKIAVGSATVRAAIADLFEVSVDRLAVVPPGWDHLRIRRPANPPRSRKWSAGRFLLYAANTSPHKNHEVLFRAVAMWGVRVPLVLTGLGADLPEKDWRGQQLRELAAACGLVLGDSLIPLGYVPDDEYYGLLTGAWAVVMPSFLEGGGSFPAMEALTCGVPVVSSDIPIMREVLARVQGKVLWFNPHDPADLARKLGELDGNYEHYRKVAKVQATTLRFPTWNESAQAYWEIMTSP